MRAIKKTCFFFPQLFQFYDLLLQTQTGLQSDFRFRFNVRGTFRLPVSTQSVHKTVQNAPSFRQLVFQQLQRIFHIRRSKFLVHPQINRRQSVHPPFRPLQVIILISDRKNSRFFALLGNCQIPNNRIYRPNQQSLRHFKFLSRANVHQ